MSSRLKRRRRKEPPDKWTSDEKAEEMMDYMEAKLNNVWGIERGLADHIIESLKRNGIDDVFKLDKLTKGRGNCFMVATIQQLRREEVYEASTPEVREVATSMNHRFLRQSVCDWIRENLTHPKIVRMKELYDLDQDIKKNLGEEIRTWDNYWNHMLEDGIWADNWFVQACAMFLRMDYWIMDTTCTKERPYFQVDGNLEDGDYCRETLYLGLVHETHYQSLLLVDDEEVDVNHEKGKEMINERKSKDGKEEEMDVDKGCSGEDEEENDIWENAEKAEDNKCPVCKKEFKKLMMHIKKAKNCNSRIDGKKLLELESKSKIIRKDKVRQMFKDIEKIRCRKWILRNY